MLKENEHTRVVLFSGLFRSFLTHRYSTWFQVKRPVQMLLDLVLITCPLQRCVRTTSFLNRKARVGKSWFCRGICELQESIGRSMWLRTPTGILEIGCCNVLRIDCLYFVYSVLHKTKRLLCTPCGILKTRCAYIVQSVSSCPTRDWYSVCLGGKKL